MYLFCYIHVSGMSAISTRPHLDLLINFDFFKNNHYERWCIWK